MTEQRAPTRPRPRKAVYGPPPGRWPELTDKAACACFLAALAIFAGVAVTLVRAEEEPGMQASELIEERPATLDRFVPSARGTRATVARWTDLVEQYDWDVPTALRVIDCESGGDPGAVNPYSGAAGLFQLYGWSRLARRLFGDGRVLIPWVNVATAHALWEDSGERFGWHWYASRRCWGA